MSKDTYIESFNNCSWSDFGDGFISNADIRRLSDASREQVWGGIQSLGKDAPAVGRGQTKPLGEKGMGGGQKKVANTRGDGGFHPKVAVVGDFMTDVYHIGKAVGLSAEVPIPVVKIKETKYFWGGAGNVAENLTNLGCTIFNPSPAWAIKPHKNRLIVDDTQLARWDEDDVCMPCADRYLFLSTLVDAIVVADYAKGTIDRTTIDNIKRNAKEGVSIFVDTKRDPSVWSGVATAIFPNHNEWSKFELQYAAFDGLVVGKDGPNGLTLYKNGRGVFAESPAKARFVRSVNGAGDTVLAAFVYKFLLENRGGYFDTQNTWQDILDFANAAAAIAVEHPYTYAPTLDEVNERYYEL